MTDPWQLGPSITPLGWQSEMIEVGRDDIPSPLTMYKNSAAGPRNSDQHETKASSGEESNASFWVSSLFGDEKSPTSCRAIYSAFASEQPRISALVSPRFSWWIIRSLSSLLEYCSRISPDSSVEPSFTTATSASGCGGRRLATGATNRRGRFAALPCCGPGRRCG